MKKEGKVKWLNRPNVLVLVTFSMGIEFSTRLFLDTFLDLFLLYTNIDVKSESGAIFFFISPSQNVFAGKAKHLEHTGVNVSAYRLRNYSAGKSKQFSYGNAGQNISMTL